MTQGRGWGMQVGTAGTSEQELQESLTDNWRHVPGRGAQLMQRFWGGNVTGVFKEQRGQRDWRE